MQFSKAQRTQINLAMNEAEERATRYYCIPPHRWQELRYDLLTRQDSEWEAFPDDALARVRCFQRTDKHRNSSFDFYRIELNDPSILTVATEENLGTNLYPFFLYILTHEMVHLIRLSSMIGGDAATLTPTLEESRVSSVSHQILAGNAHLIHLLERFTAPRRFNPSTQ